MVEQITGEYQDLSIEEIKNRPEIVTDWLMMDDDVSMILEKRRQRIRFAYLKRYDSETMRILDEAKKNTPRKKEKGIVENKRFRIS